MPQSTRTRARPVSTRCLDPVTVRAPPRKVSSIDRIVPHRSRPDGRAWHDAPMPTATALAALQSLEASYLAARDARDRLDVARATGLPADPSGLVREAAATEAAAREALASVDGAGGDGGGLPPEDPRGAAAR